MPEQKQLTREDFEGESLIQDRLYDEEVSVVEVKDEFVRMKWPHNDWVYTYRYPLDGERFKLGL